MSTGARLGILAGIIAIAIVVLVIANGGSDNSSSTATTAAPASATSQSTGASTTAAPTPAGPKTFTVVVKNAKPAGGVKQIKVKKGDQVRIIVKSDTADEVHLHGYDIKKDVKPGGSVTFNVKATSDGGYEMELESRAQQIAELTVEP
jgi:FtsP/CotA-like multicopper oxidase with cupredoxin domain